MAIYPNAISLNASSNYFSGSAESVSPTDPQIEAHVDTLLAEAGHRAKHHLQPAIRFDESPNYDDNRRCASSANPSDYGESYFRNSHLSDPDFDDPDFGDLDTDTMSPGGPSCTATTRSVSQGAGAAGQPQAPGATGTAAPLSTEPQTTALSPEQGKQVADSYVENLRHDFGLTKDQAAGIVANLWHESGGMNSGINQGGAIGQPDSNMGGDNMHGYGIAQWDGPRKQDFLNYATEHNLNPSSQAANYGFLKQELETTQAGAIAAVKATDTPQAATEAFCNVFENPSDPELQSRLSHLQDILG
jgi:hypothetical protein